MLVDLCLGMRESEEDWLALGRGLAARGLGTSTASGGKIVEIDVLLDPERLGRLDLTVLDEG